MVYYFLGIITYMYNLILFWFVLIDCRDLLKNLTLTTDSEFFILTYQRMFAVIFWFVVFGPFGLILYTVVISLYVIFSCRRNPFCC